MISSIYHEIIFE